MAIKRFQTRICNKTDSVENLSPSSDALVPLRGEIVIGTNGASNTTNAPFKMKIGDGMHTWTELPLMSPYSFTGTTLAATNPTGQANQVINVPVPQDTRLYGYYRFSDDTDDTSFTIHVTGSDILRTDHYILLDNSNSMYDRLFNGIQIDGVAAGRTFIQKEWVSAYDITEVKISLYEAGGNLYATVTTVSGITNGGNT